MKKVIASIFVCIMLVSAFLLVSCGNSKVEFKLKFIVDGETYSTINTNGNEVISIPQSPTKEGYTFDGWFWDEGTWQRPFTANSLLNEPLSSDMSVYAKWGEIAAEPEPTPELSGTDLSSSALTVSGETANATLSNATQTFSFLNDIKIADGASYILANDIGCQNVIASKTVALEEGNNTYYLLVTNGNEQKLYTVTIRRRPIYIVEFNTNGGTRVETLYVEEDNTIEMQQTSKTGYTLDGWIIDGRQIEFPYQVKKSENIVAKWSAISYTIEYELNNGINNAENVSNYTIEQTVSLKNPTRDYYTFAGWYDNESLEGTPASEIPQETTGNKIFYAKWIPVQYEIKYELNGGTNNTENVSNYTIEQTVSLKNPTRNGYAFLGWFTENTFDNKVEKIAIGSNGNKSFYAKWTPNNNTLVFDANSGSGSMSDMTIATDASVNLTTNAFTKYGYTFVGWSTSANGSVEYTDGTSYTMGTNATCTLYAVWEATEYTITYYKNGGTETTENPVKFTIEDLPITLNDLSKTNYLFNYWYKESDFTGSPVLQIADVGNITLYAEYVECTYGIKFIDKNGKLTVNNYVGTSNNVVIPKSYKGKSVISIEISAFDGCKSLESVTIPNSVTSIGSLAFSGCSSLTRVTIPNGVTSIGNGAFHGCDSLKYNEYDNAYYLGNDANPYVVLVKAKSTDITSCIINENTRVIYSAFFNCSSLTEVTIPNSVTEIGNSAFSGCTSLTSVTIPDSVTKIKDYAFEDCTKLTSVNISNIASWCNITFVTPDANPLFYAEKLYVNNELVTDLVIPDAVTEIKSYAFYSFLGLTSVTIGENVTEIGYSAFAYCNSLKSVTIPNRVTKIEGYAFRFCLSLTSIIIPNSVTSIESSAFDFCTSLTIYCEAENQPSGWDSEWNSSNCPVEWGCTGKQA